MRQPLSDEYLRQVRERCNRATPGPWTISRLARGYVLVDSEQYIPIATTVEYNEDGSVHMVFGGKDCEANQSFIAHAREDIPRLLGALEAAYAEIERLRNIFGHEVVHRALKHFTDERYEPGEPDDSWEIAFRARCEVSKLIKEREFK